MKSCIVCDRPTNSCCELCKIAFYCSRQHQAQDWNRHKAICTGRLKTEFGTSSNSESQKKSTVNVKSRVSSNAFQRDTRLNLRQLQTEPPSIIQNSQRNSSPETLKKTLQSSRKATIEEMSFRADHFIELDQRRKTQRKSLILQYVRAKEETLIGRCNGLIKLSHQIWKEFTQELPPFLFKQYRIRTSSTMQRLEYILDMAYLGKLLLRQGDREKLKQLLFQLQLPELSARSQPDIHELNQNDMDAWQNSKQQIEAYRKCLSLLAAISNAAGFVNFTERLYSKFITLVEANLGMNEQFLAYYMIGIWYTEVDQHNKAIACFEQSIRLKESHKKVQVSNKIEFQEKPSEMLVGNCYYNIALCQRMINQVRQATESMLKCLSIRREQPTNNKIEISDCLEFIAKQLMEEEKFDQSIDYLNECHKIRNDLLKADDPSLLKLKQLVKLLYSVIKTKRAATSTLFHLGDADGLVRTENRLSDIIRKNYPEIETYLDKIRKDPKAKLNIKIDTEWFNTMKPQELESFAQIVRSCEELDALKVAEAFFSSKFYSGLTPEQKTAIKELNPELQYL